MRLFIALVPPSAIAERLRFIMHGLAGARWQHEEQLHLTLQFLGEGDRHQLGQLRGGLARENWRLPPVRLSGIGHFEQKGAINALWAGVMPEAPIAAMHRACRQLAGQAGFVLETRNFVPHITIARFSRTTARHIAQPSGPLDDYLAEYADLASPDFHFDRLVLFESHIGDGGSSYRALESFPVARIGETP